MMEKVAMIEWIFYTLSLCFGIVVIFTLFYIIHWLNWRSSRTSHEGMSSRHRGGNDIGPRGVPFLGILPRILLRNIWPFRLDRELSIPMFLYRHKIGEEYADQGFYICKIGSQRVVTLQNYDAIKEALLDNGDLFANRPENVAFKKECQDYGLSFNASTENWQQVRKFSFAILKNLASNRFIMEKKIQEESSVLLQNIDQSINQSIDPFELFSPAMANIISELLFGEHWSSYTDPQLHHCINLVKNISMSSSIWSMLEYFYPQISQQLWMKRLFKINHSSQQQSFNELEKLVREKVEKIKKIYFPTSGTTKLNPREPINYVEAFLKEYQNKSNTNEVIMECTRCAQDLLMAGTDTTTQLLSWAFLYLAIYPEVQKKLQHEIDSMITLKDTEIHFHFSINLRPSLPYTCAVMDEIQRVASIVPLSLDRTVNHTIQFRGQEIHPTDVVMTNIYGVHHDPHIWNDPDKFDPERFLSIHENGSMSYIPSKYLIPFGLGKRQCLGENLAKMDFFIILCSILRRFNVYLAPDSVKNIKQILLGQDGIVRSPGKHKLIFRRRT